MSFPMPKRPGPQQPPGPTVTMSVPELMVKIARSKGTLILDHPFWATLVCNRDLELAEDLPFPTAATDGVTIWMHPLFVQEKTVPNLVFALAHEAAHKMYDHMTRRAGRDFRLWNQACDYVINDMLISGGVGKPPEGILVDPGLVAQGKTADGVYDILKARKEEEGGGGGDEAGDEPGWDTVYDRAVKTAEEREQAERETKIEIAQAANAAKMAGRMPGELDVFVKDLLKEQVDWKGYLRRFCEARAQEEYTYARPHRRFMCQDLYLPSLNGVGMGEMLVMVDCSGSCLEAIPAFGSEIAAIQRDLRPERLHVIYFDTRVSHVESYEPEDPVDIKVHGGGGTAFSPAFRKVDELGINPAVCVVLTDLECSDFGPAPGYPVLWVSTDPGRAPFGEIVVMGKGS